MTSTRASGPNWTTGRGPSGKDALQTAQARTSRRRSERAFVMITVAWLPERAPRLVEERADVRRAQAVGLIDKIDGRRFGIEVGQDIAEPGDRHVMIGLVVEGSRDAHALERRVDCDVDAVRHEARLRSARQS